MFLVKTPAGAVLAEATTHWDARRIAERITSALEIFGPDGVKLGWRNRVSRRAEDLRVHFAAAEDLLPEFDQ